VKQLNRTDPKSIIKESAYAVVIAEHIQKDKSRSGAHLITGLVLPADKPRQDRSVVEDLSGG
jgi:hypothetical protein